MSTNLDHHASEPNEINNADSGTDLTLDSVARRRLLLKNIGKGAAALAATVPVQTLAQGTALLTADGRRCSVSGMQSGVHSQSPDSSSICGGYSPGWWQQNSHKKAKHWPSNVNPDAPYNAVFTHDSVADITNSNGTTRVPTLWEVMHDAGSAGYRNTDLWHWIGAWLNGFDQTVFNFPYNHAEILSFYNLPTSDINRVKALELIKVFLETHTQ